MANGTTPVALIQQAKACATAGAPNALCEIFFDAPSKCLIALQPQSAHAALRRLLSSNTPIEA